MSKNSKSTTARHNILFNLNDEQQRIAHEYLARLERKQAKTIAQLICSMLAQNGIKDVSVLSKETLEELALSPATKTQQVNVQNMEEMATMFEKAFASAIKFASASTLSKEGIVTGEPKTVGNTVLIQSKKLELKTVKKRMFYIKRKKTLTKMIQRMILMKLNQKMTSRMILMKVILILIVNFSNPSYDKTM